MYDKYLEAFAYILDQYRRSDSYFVQISWDGAPLVKDAVMELKRLGYTTGPKAIGSLSFYIDPDGVDFLEDVVGQGTQHR